MTYKYIYTKLDEPTNLFQVTPGKNCRMFPYLWTEECAAYYQNKPPGLCNPYQCPAKGPVDQPKQYTGYTVNFEYDLAGTKCNQPINENPRVL